MRMFRWRIFARATDGAHAVHTLQLSNFRIGLQLLVLPLARGPKVFAFPIRETYSVSSESPADVLLKIQGIYAGFP